MSDRIPAIKVLLLPKDTNALGTIFGGVILSHIDLASAVEARKTAPHRYVTKAMNAVEFHAPVFVGDLVNFFTETVRVGRTSITVKVIVEAERWGAGQGEQVRVTEAEVILVAIGPDGLPVPIRPDRQALYADWYAPNDCRLRTGIRLKCGLRLRRLGICPRRARRHRFGLSAG